MPFSVRVKAVLVQKYQTIVMCHSVKGYVLRSVSFSNFVIAQTLQSASYANLDARAYYTLGYTVQPITPRLQACTACYCTKQHNIKLSTRENDEIQRLHKHKMYEAAASVTRHTVLQYFFYIERVHSKITKAWYSKYINQQQSLFIIIKFSVLYVTVCSILL